MFFWPLLISFYWKKQLKKQKNVKNSKMVLKSINVNCKTETTLGEIG